MKIETETILKVVLVRFGRDMGSKMFAVGSMTAVCVRTAGVVISLRTARLSRVGVWIVDLVF